MAYIRTCVQNLGAIRWPVRKKLSFKFIIGCVQMYIFIQVIVAVIDAG